MKDFSVIKIRIILYELHHFEEESGPFHIKQSIYRKIFYLFREETFSASRLKRENSKEGGTRRKGVWARTFQPVQFIWNNFMVPKITKFHIFSITVFIWTFCRKILNQGATFRNFWSWVGPVLNFSICSVLDRLVQIHWQIICSRIYYRFATEILSVAVCSRYISVANL